MVEADTGMLKDTVDPKSSISTFYTKVFGPWCRRWFFHKIKAEDNSNCYLILKTTQLVHGDVCAVVWQAQKSGSVSDNSSRSKKHDSCSIEKSLLPIIAANGTKIWLLLFGEITPVAQSCHAHDLLGQGHFFVRGRCRQPASITCGSVHRGPQWAFSRHKVDGVEFSIWMSMEF